MKFYSEVTKKLYDEKSELEAAEYEFEQKHKAEEEAKNKEKMERAAAAKRVEEASAKLNAARDEYYKEITEFCTRFGPYHYSVTFDDKSGKHNSTLSSFFNW